MSSSTSSESSSATSTSSEPSESDSSTSSSDSPAPTPDPPSSNPPTADPPPSSPAPPPHSSPPPVDTTTPGDGGSVPPSTPSPTPPPPVTVTTLSTSTINGTIESVTMTHVNSLPLQTSTIIDSITPTKTFLTPHAITITSGSVVFTTLPSMITTVIVTTEPDGEVITETTVIANPTLNPNDQSNSSFASNKGAIAAVVIVPVLALAAIALWGFFAYRRRRGRRQIEHDSATAAMAAAGIPLPRVFPDTPGVIEGPTAFFEDGTPVSSAIERDMFNPFLAYREPDMEESGRHPKYVAGAGYAYESIPTAGTGRRSSSGHLYPTGAVSSSGHGNESSIAHEPLLPPVMLASRTSSGSGSGSGSNSLSGSGSAILQATSRPHSPTLVGTFQHIKRTSETSNFNPPAPPHILTAYGPPPTHAAPWSPTAHIPLINRSPSPKSVYSQADSTVGMAMGHPDPGGGSGPYLKPQDNDDAKGSSQSIGLGDHNDYWPKRPRLTIRNRTGSSRTFGTEASGRADS